MARQNGTQIVLDRAAKVCAERGVRLTAQRTQVLELVAGAKNPVSAYDILEEMQGDGPRLAPTTVYRALDFLLEQGLVHKLESLHAFVTCDHPDQPHDSQFFICADCGEVDEVEHPKVSSSLAKAEAGTGLSLRAFNR